MKPCSQCGKPIPNGVKECETCGAEQPDMKVKPFTPSSQPEPSESDDARAAFDLFVLEPIRWLCPVVGGFVGFHFFGWLGAVAGVIIGLLAWFFVV
jgi:hypothetical protein